jgi:hypothetical protein
VVGAAMHPGRRPCSATVHDERSCVRQTVHSGRRLRAATVHDKHAYMQSADRPTMDQLLASTQSAHYATAPESLAQSAYGDHSEVAKQALATGTSSPAASGSSGAVMVTPRDSASSVARSKPRGRGAFGLFMCCLNPGARLADLVDGVMRCAVCAACAVCAVAPCMIAAGASPRGCLCRRG